MYLHLHLLLLISAGKTSSWHWAQERYTCLNCISVPIHLPWCLTLQSHLLPPVHSRHKMVQAPAWWHYKQLPSAVKTSVPSHRSKCPKSIRRKYSLLVSLSLQQSYLSQDKTRSKLPPPVPLKICYSYSDLGMLFCLLETAVLMNGNWKRFINSIIGLEKLKKRAGLNL